MTVTGLARRYHGQAAMVAGGTLVFVLASIVGAPLGQSTLASPHILAGEVHNGELVQFKTDECGDLSAVQNPRWIISNSSADEFDHEDEDDWIGAWGMSDEDLMISKQWMLWHPDTAVDTDAVQRSCGSDAVSDHDSGTNGIA